jgi:hypothetical protein
MAWGVTADDEAVLRGSISEVEGIGCAIFTAFEVSGAGWLLERILSAIY